MTDALFNPHMPDRLGPEWSVIRSGATSMRRGLAAGELQPFTATVTEGIDWFMFPSASGQGGRWGVEIFVAGNEVPGAAATAPLPPSRVDVFTGVTNYSGSVVPATLVSDISDNNDGTGLVFTKQPGATPSYIDIGFSGAPAGVRVLGVGALVKMIGRPGQMLTASIYDQASAVESELLGNITPGGPSFPVPYTTSEVQQAIGQVWWTTLILTNFNSVTPNGYRLRLKLAGDNALGEFVLVSEVRFAVVVCVENRAACGVAGVIGNPGVPHSVPAWQAASLVVPNTLSGPWAKVAGTPYSMVVRPLDAPGFGTISARGDYRWQYLAGRDPVDLTDLTSRGAAPVSIDVYGRITGIGQQDRRRIHGWALWKTGASVFSVDSQPFNSVSVVGPSLTAGVLQEFISDNNGGTYGWARILLRRNPASLPTGQLLVDVQEVGSGSIVATGFLLPGQFADPSFGTDVGDGWRMVEVPFLAPFVIPPVGPFEYRLRVASTSPTVDWQVMALGTVDPSGTGLAGVTLAKLNATTYAGASVSAGTFTIVPPPALIPSLDGEMGVVRQLADLVAFTATADGQQYFENVEACGGDAVMPFVRFTWGVPGIVGGSPVAYTEIQRRDPVGDRRWHTIRHVALRGLLVGEDPALYSSTDYEMWPDLTSEYRARVVFPSGAHSAWSAISTATPVGGPGITLTSNLLPGLNLGFVDVAEGARPVRAYTSLDGPEIRAHDDRDMQTGFIDAERRGWQFQRQVLVNADRSPGSVATTAQFDALVRLARAGMHGVEDADETDVQLPYVCVRERGGGRFFATVRVDGARIRLGKRAMHTATITVTDARPVPTVAVS